VKADSFSNMEVEKTEIWITCEKPREGDGKAVRGFFGNLYRNRPAFHGHRRMDDGQQFNFNPL